MVLRGFAVQASHVLYRLARNGRRKPIEESHAVGLTSIESIQHIGTPAVVERIYGENCIIISADDGFVVPPTGVGAATSGLLSPIICMNIACTASCRSLYW